MPSTLRSQAPPAISDYKEVSTFRHHLLQPFVPKGLDLIRFTLKVCKPVSGCCADFRVV